MIDGQSVTRFCHTVQADPEEVPLRESVAACAFRSDNGAGVKRGAKSGGGQCFSIALEGTKPPACK